MGGWPASVGVLIKKGSRKHTTYGFPKSDTIWTASHRQPVHKTRLSVTGWSAELSPNETHWMDVYFAVNL